MNNATLTKTTATHRAYVADLAAYVGGQLIGQWIDLDGLDADQMKAAVQSVIDASPYPGAEEYAIHDWDGVPSSFGEWPDWEAVAAYVEARQGMNPETLEAFEIWHSWAPSDNNDVEDFREAYCGAYQDGAEFASYLADELGLEFENSWPYNCIDWEQAWYELRIGGDNWAEFGSHGFHVFRSI
jgi:antirestriction protein